MISSHSITVFCFYTVQQLIGSSCMCKMCFSSCMVLFSEFGILGSSSIYIYLNISIKKNSLFSVIFNHADLLFRSSLPRFAQTFICTLLYSYLSLLMCSFAKKSIFKYPFLTLFLLTLPTVFLLLPPPFLSLPLSGKSHGFPEVERHKAWSAGGSLPSFIFMLCMSSPLIG